MIPKLRLWLWKRRYRPGLILTRFLAPDIRRDVEVIDVLLIDEGVIAARTRTWNVLYSIRGIEPIPPFGAIRMIPIGDLWKWPEE